MFLKNGEETIRECNECLGGKFYKNSAAPASLASSLLLIVMIEFVCLY